MKRIMLTSLLMATVIFQSFSQGSNWTLPVDEKIKFFLISQSGNLLTYGENTLYSIDPSTKSIVWKNSQLKDITAESFVQIDNTPLYRIKSTKVNSEIHILNSANGKLVFSSPTAGFTSVVFDKIIWNLSSILIEGIVNGKYSLSLVSLKTGEITWSTQISDKSSVGMMGMMKQVATPVLDKDQKLYYAFGSTLLKLNSVTGSIEWKAEAKKNIRIISLSPDATKVAVTYGAMGPNAVIQEGETGVVTQGLPSFVVAFSGIDGKAMFEEPLKIKGSFGRLIAEDDHFKAMDNITMQKFNYSGQPLWEKPVKMGGDEIMTINTERGTLTAVAGTYTNLKYIDANGSPIFANEPKFTGTVKAMELRPEGFFYIASEANIIDMTTGEKKLPTQKDLYIQSNSPSFFDTKNNIWIILSADQLIEVDNKTAETRIVASKVKIDLADPLQKIEKLSDGYVFISSQSIRKIDNTGKLVYEKKYEAPNTVSGKEKFLLGTLSAVATVASSTYTASAFSSAAQGNMAGVENNLVAASMAEDFGSAFEAQKNRTTKASTTTQADIFMLSTTASKKQIRFVQVNKASGAEVKSYVLEKMNPVYIVDKIDNKLYYTVSENEIACIELN